MTDQSTQINTTLTCSFCDKSNDKVGYLIVGPEDNRICDLCVDQFCEFLDNPAYIGTEDEDAQCSFCTLSRNEVENIIPASDLNMNDPESSHANNVCICDKCVDACCEILQEIQETN